MTWRGARQGTAFRQHRFNHLNTGALHRLTSFRPTGHACSANGILVSCGNSGIDCVDAVRLPASCEGKLSPRAVSENAAAVDPQVVPTRCCESPASRHKRSRPHRAVRDPRRPSATQSARGIFRASCRALLESIGPRILETNIRRGCDRAIRNCSSSLTCIDTPRACPLGQSTGAFGIARREPMASSVSVPNTRARRGIVQEGRTIYLARGAAKGGRVVPLK
jgi:hypothetical protein